MVSSDTHGGQLGDSGWRQSGRHLDDHHRAAVFPAEATLAAESSADSPGISVSGRSGCIACHSVDGSDRIGPTWKRLYGKREALADGPTVTVDEAYVRESILVPDVRIVSGYVPGSMPTRFRQEITDDQIEAIIEYIRSLK